MSIKPIIFIIPFRQPRIQYLSPFPKNYKGIELRAKHEEGRIQLQKEKETKERKEGFIMNITNLLLYNGT